ncbi:hypothetical protein O1611_g6264 [Lasiodiplodia mahajangana]|uniref:Uncharacterized protein n=1 Tax=Lasiodiplodia mahajangana TaxID=1108764 RepID=A0ACC2JJ42_9PEZI|nr:hypothetical protein O1611_g6264 [Lasiodiplodia mahajangana]
MVVHVTPMFMLEAAHHQGTGASTTHFGPEARSCDPRLPREGAPLLESPVGGSGNTTHVDLHGIIDAIAQDMTMVVRSPDAGQLGMDALVKIEDSETIIQVIVRVRWVWLALLATLLGAGSFFMLETLIKSSSWELQSWMSSSLAVLFVGMSLSDEVE